MFTCRPWLQLHVHELDWFMCVNTEDPVGLNDTFWVVSGFYSKIGKTATENDVYIWREILNYAQGGYLTTTIRITLPFLLILSLVSYMHASYFNWSLSTNSCNSSFRGSICQGFKQRLIHSSDLRPPTPRPHFQACREPSTQSAPLPGFRVPST